MNKNLLGVPKDPPGLNRVNQGAKSRKATPQSAHESFDAGPGNYTEMSTMTFLGYLKESPSLGDSS